MKMNEEEFYSNLSNRLFQFLQLQTNTVLMQSDPEVVQQPVLPGYSTISKHFEPLFLCNNEVSIPPRLG